MEKKAMDFSIKGMNRDLSVTAFSKEFAYTNMNIRLITEEDNSLLQITNEKGTKDIGTIDGIPIGTCVIDNYLIIFSTNNNGSDYIHRIKDANFDNIELIYRGNLGFKVENTLSTLGYYEGEDVVKVYWADGKNNIRFINVTKSYGEYSQNGIDVQFDFVPILNYIENVEITKGYSGGMFPSGVIQYVFTYHNKYGAETNIAYVTPLYYITNADKGASPDETCSNTFRIQIPYANLDSNFEYIRIYSIIRTSYNSDVMAKKVIDIKIESDKDIDYIDANTAGEVIDPYEILLKIKESLKCKTLTSKNNTLFIANIKKDNLELEDFYENVTIQPKLKLKSPPSENSDAELRTYTMDDLEGTFCPNKNNLNTVSKHFKSNNYYRFGIQFITDRGVLSNVYPIGDAIETLYPNMQHKLVNSNQGATNICYRTMVPSFNITVPFKADSEVHKFNKARIVRALPLANNSVLFQGLVSPTLYFASDEEQIKHASWYFRPLIPDASIPHLSYQHGEPLQDASKHFAEIQSSNTNSSLLKVRVKCGYRTKKIANYINSESGDYSDYFVYNNSDSTRGRYMYDFFIYTLDTDNNEGDKIAVISTFLYSDLVHRLAYYGIDITNNGNLPKADLDWISSREESLDFENVNVVDDNHNAIVDYNTCTINTPDIQNFSFLNNNSLQLKFRTVGSCAITSSKSDYILQTKGGTFGNDYSLGDIKENFNVPNFSTAAWGMLSPYIWHDNSRGTNENDDVSQAVYFKVYPWHRTGALNDSSLAEDIAEEKQTNAELTLKIEANLKYAALTNYYREEIDSDIAITSLYDPRVIINWNYINNFETSYPPYKVYDDTEESIITVNEFLYKGNVSKQLANKLPYPIYFKNSLTDSQIHKEKDGSEPISIKYKSTPHLVVNVPMIAQVFNTNLSNFAWFEEGNPEVNNFNNVYDAPTVTSTNGENGLLSDDDNGDNQEVPLSEHDSGYDGGGNSTPSDPVVTTSNKLIPNSGIVNIVEAFVDTTAEEVYGDPKNNQWIPCSKFKTINGNNIEFFPEELDGDTYFDRWECLKTYPYTSEDKNQLIEILSCMIESYTNLSGRYDNNINTDRLVQIDNTNFNQFNKVYDQENNFFNYRIIEDQLDKMPNLIAWSLTKSNKELVDTWAAITTTSGIFADGNLGEVVSLNNTNNNILCFQKNGFSQILYNEQVQIPTSAGSPIEISNSGKVQGLRVISNTIGCQNKEAIQITENGIYFINGYTGDLYLYGESFSPINRSKGMTNIIKTNTKEWDPVDFNNYILRYDNKQKELMIISEDMCLNYSENLGQFTSFYNYEKTPYTFNYQGELYSIRNRNVDKDSAIYHIWKHRAGEYNNFFGENYGFYIELIANDNYKLDKVFGNIDFRGDMYDGSTLLDDCPFNFLQVSNEYQDTGVTALVRRKNLSKKFRVWRAEIGRDKTHKRDRIRNLWAKVKIGRQIEETTEHPNLKSKINDITLYYYV